MALRRALTLHNFKKGFSTIGIYPFIINALNHKLGPRAMYENIVALDSQLNLQAHDLDGLNSYVQKTEGLH